MARRPDDITLLEFVEHPLADAGEAPRAPELEETLHGEVELMRRDRAILRGLAAPPLPRDFVAEVVDLLEPPAPVVPGTGRPGPFLRLVRDWTGHRSFGRAVAGLSLAACCGAAVATAIWVTVGGSWGGSRPAGLATAPERAIVDAMPPVVETPRRVYPLDAELHHRAPTLGDSALAGATRATRSGDAAEAAAPAKADLSGGAVALVIQADSATQGVEALRRAVETSSPQQAALVRNVTYREAGNLEFLIRARDGATADRTPAMASREPAGAASSIERPRVVTDPSLDTATLGEHLAGPRSAATAPDLQLLLSDDGFTHSVSVPVERLRDLVLALAFDEAVRMQMGRRDALAPAKAGSIPAPARNAWQRWKDAAEMIEELERTVPKGTRVVIAARVREAKGG